MSQESQKGLTKAAYDEKETEELIAEIVARREIHGESYKAIGDALCLPKSTVYSLYKNRPKIGNFERITMQQRKFLRGLLDGQDEHTAALEAGVDARGVKKFLAECNHGDFRTAMERHMARQGLSIGYLMRRLKQQVGAQRTIYATFEGKISDTKQVADNSARMAAIKTGLKLLGADKQTEQDEPRRINITLSPKMQEFARAVSNRPLEELAGAGVIDITPTVFDTDQPRDENGRFRPPMTAPMPAKSARPDEIEWEDVGDVIVETDV